MRARLRFAPLTLDFSRFFCSSIGPLAQAAIPDPAEGVIHGQQHLGQNGDAPQYLAENWGIRFPPGVDKV
jgi:hypothetical protein